MSYQLENQPETSEIDTTHVLPQEEMEDIENLTTENEQTVHQIDTEEVDDLADYQLARDKQRRVTRPSSRYRGSEFVGYAFNCYTDSYEAEPTTYIQAIKSQHKNLWLEAM